MVPSRARRRKTGMANDAYSMVEYRIEGDSDSNRDMDRIKALRLFTGGGPGSFSRAALELGIGQPAATSRSLAWSRNSARACCIGPRMACRPPMSASAATMQAHRAPRRGSPLRGRADAVAGSRNAAHQHLGRLRPPRAGADGAGLHARPCAADGGPELRRPLRQSGRAGRGRGGAHGPAGRFLAGRDLPGQQPWVVVASAAYLERRGAPVRPEALADHEALVTAPRRATPSGISPAAARRPWPFR